jgi:hypothetical protein
LSAPKFRPNFGEQLPLIQYHAPELSILLLLLGGMSDWERKAFGDEIKMTAIADGNMMPDAFLIGDDGRVIRLISFDSLVTNIREAMVRSNVDLLAHLPIKPVSAWRKYR